MLPSFNQILARGATQFRHSLASFDALPQLTTLGAIIGCLCGLLIVLFRLAIQAPLDYFLPAGSESFEALSPLWHFSLPVIGALFIGLILRFIPTNYHAVNVGHVLERVHNYQGRISVVNWLVQFFGGILCLLTGQSIGREGPAVMIGAGAASMTGQWLRLPNNSLNTLVGCGVAAAISASFNTPIAGVIFAMEVVLMRYTITGFIPVMIASFCGLLITRATMGEDLFFSVQNTNIDLIEIPFLLISGLIIGVFAAFYMLIHLRCHRFAQYPIFLRLFTGGLITGAIGVWFPEILGLGYDTINAALRGELTIPLLLGIAVAKIVATGISIGLGMPGGLIGPQLFIGACLGSLMGSIGLIYFPEIVDNPIVYVLVGMAAMMGAVLNAPLAALTAVLELTYSPAIIFPSLLTIVIACLTTRIMLKREGIFVEQLKQQGTTLNNGPMQQVLGNVGVCNAMTTAFVQTNVKITIKQVKRLLQGNPVWLIVYRDQEDNEPRLLNPSDLDLAITSSLQNGGESIAEYGDSDPTFDLSEMTQQWVDWIFIDELASLLEAKQMIDASHAKALIVTTQKQTSKERNILGIISIETINNYAQ